MTRPPPAQPPTTVPPPAPICASSPSTAPASPEPAPSLPETEPAWSLTQADVLLQLEEEPTFAVGSAIDPAHPYGRVPSFTLYRDGTVLFQDGSRHRRGLLQYHMFERVAEDHLEHVRQLGVTRLHSHEDDCIPRGRTQLCVADASVLILRARLPDGSVRELRNYNGFEPKLPAPLHAIYDRIARLSQPRGGADHYLPHAATLFVHRARPPSELDAAVIARARPWPLGPELLARALASGVEVLAVPEIRTMFAATGTNSPQDVLFILGEDLVHATMIPWLPGQDHRAAIAQRPRDA
ncbi:hypothetical protein [Nannocystis punicea]|uniref:Uncharacterized protein n=1 Tax=Nannocystis punicea TaxID=2995304 RepID=A0ABY7GU22_9BACT|nr:hypothetical protein [Nannocystis poenicansa]WAS90452.1 hypothetical protein O0S08_30045 [Nannocystis poenicansa]